MLDQRKATSPTVQPRSSAIKVSRCSRRIVNNRNLFVFFWRHAQEREQMIKQRFKEIEEGVKPDNLRTATKVAMNRWFYVAMNRKWMSQIDHHCYTSIQMVYQRTMSHVPTQIPILPILNPQRVWMRDERILTNFSDILDPLPPPPPPPSTTIQPHTPTDFNVGKRPSHSPS